MSLIPSHQGTRTSWVTLFQHSLLTRDVLLMPPPGSPVEAPSKTKASLLRILGPALVLHADWPLSENYDLDPARPSVPIHSSWLSCKCWKKQLPACYPECQIDYSVPPQSYLPLTLNRSLITTQTRLTCVVLAIHRLCLSFLLVKSCCLVPHSLSRWTHDLVWTGLYNQHPARLLQRGGSSPTLKRTKPSISRSSPNCN